MSACVCACLRECGSVCVRVCECVHPLASYTAIISVTLIKRWGPGAGLGPDTLIKSVCGRARRCQHRLVFKSDSFSSGSFPSPSSFNHWPTPVLAQTKPCHTRAPTPSSHLCTVCRPPSAPWQRAAAGPEAAGAHGASSARRAHGPPRGEAPSGASTWRGPVGTTRERRRGLGFGTQRLTCVSDHQRPRSGPAGSSRPGSKLAGDPSHMAGPAGIRLSCPSPILAWQGGVAPGDVPCPGGRG